MLKITESYSLSKTGKRESNQDYCYPLAGHEASGNSMLYIVCDGVGGNKGGDIASQTAVNSFVNFLGNQAEVSEDLISEAFDSVLSDFNSTIEKDEKLQTMATTAAILKFNPNSFIIAHCGDSRAYHIRNNTVVFKTKDHSLVNDLLAAGVITPEEAADGRQSSKITRAIQVQNIKTAVPEFYQSTDVQNGDIFVLCSDGIWECVDDTLLLTILSQNNIENAVKKIDEICNNTAKDNYTLIVLSVSN